MIVIRVQWWSVNIGSGNGLPIRQWAITWTNVDTILCGHITSLGHNELTLIMMNLFKETQKSIYIFFYFTKTKISQIFEMLPHEKKTRNNWSYIFNNMATDGLVMQGTRSPRAMILSLFPWNILFSATERLINVWASWKQNNSPVNLTSINLHHLSGFNSLCYSIWWQEIWVNIV